MDIYSTAEQLEHRTALFFFNILTKLLINTAIIFFWNIVKTLKKNTFFIFEL